MAKKKKLSPTAKKVLIGCGIGGGTLLVFIISFFMALYFIINPIVWNDPAIIAENRNLREENETMKREIADMTSDQGQSGNSNSSNNGHTATPDDDNDRGTSEQSTPQGSSGGGSSSSTPVSPSRPTEITPSQSPSNSGETDEGEVQETPNDNETEETEDPSGEGTQGGSDEEGDDAPTFNPETVPTPEGGYPNDGESDITTIVLE